MSCDKYTGNMTNIQWQLYSFKWQIYSVMWCIYSVMWPVSVILTCDSMTCLFHFYVTFTVDGVLSINHSFSLSPSVSTSTILKTSSLPTHWPICGKDMLEVSTGVNEWCQTVSKNGCVLQQQNHRAVDDIQEQRQVAWPRECAGHVVEHGCHQLHK